MTHFVSQLQLHFCFSLFLHQRCSPMHDIISRMIPQAGAQHFVFKWLYTSRQAGVNHSGMFPLDPVKPLLAENQAFGLPCISLRSKSSSSSTCMLRAQKVGGCSLSKPVCILQNGKWVSLWVWREKVCFCLHSGRGCLPCIALTKKLRTRQ